MTSVDPSAVSAAEDLDEPVPAEVSLPTYVVLVRLRSTAADPLADVTARLAPVRDLHDRLEVERTEDDGSTLVVARVATVAVDAPGAVAGVCATLADAGVEVDEVWVPHS